MSEIYINCGNDLDCDFCTFKNVEELPPIIDANCRTMYILPDGSMYILNETKDGFRELKFNAGHSIYQGTYQIEDWTLINENNDPEFIYTRFGDSIEFTLLNAQTDTAKIEPGDTIILEVVEFYGTTQVLNDDTHRKTGQMLIVEIRTVEGDNKYTAKVVFINNSVWQCPILGQYTKVGQVVKYQASFIPMTTKIIEGDKYHYTKLNDLRIGDTLCSLAEPSEDNDFPQVWGQITAIKYEFNPQNGETEPMVYIIIRSSNDYYTKGEVDAKLNDDIKLYRHPITITLDKNNRNYSDNTVQPETIVFSFDILTRDSSPIAWGVENSLKDALPLLTKASRSGGIAGTGQNLLASGEAYALASGDRLNYTAHIHQVQFSNNSMRISAIQKNSDGTISYGSRSIFPEDLDHKVENIYEQSAQRIWVYQ